MKLGALFVTLACLPLVVLADLPIHCLHTETIGEWDIQLGPPSASKEKENCGHETPDRVMSMVKKKIDPFDNPGFEPKSTYRITLENPNVATGADGLKGTWTMIYDEAFEVKFPTGKTFFLFFKYMPKGPNPSPDEVNDFISTCDRTFTGWWHDTTTEGRNYGCAIGSKPGAQKSRAQKRNTGRSGQAVLQPGYMGEGGNKGCTGTTDDPDTIPCDMGLSDKSEATYIDKDDNEDNEDSSLADNLGDDARFGEQGHKIIQRQPMYDEDDEFVSDTVFIEMVNSDTTKTWKARAHTHFHGNKMKHMYSMLGRARFKKVQTVRAAVDDRSDDEKFGHLPTELDWNTKDNGIYSTPVFSQGSCGSCYAIASADAANMHVKILESKTGAAQSPRFRSSEPDSKQDDQLLSVQNAMSCSVQNQGCDGGYPYLMGKYLSEVGITKGCQDYSASNGQCNWDCLKDQLKVYRAKDYGYIGGYYGACNEAKMMEALQNGPIVVALNAPSDLFYYAEGIYDAPLAKGESDYNTKGQDQRWEKTNHAVTAVGYGEGPEVGEDGKPIKYWLIKNSWGDNWGKSGFFRMKKGSDAAAVESMSVETSMCNAKGVCTGQGDDA